MGRASLLYEEKIRSHRRFIDRAAYSLALVFSVLLVGTLGMHYLENYSYINAFYFVSMLATGEGPTTIPITAAGKLFASLIAFVSVGTVLFSLAFLFGPFMIGLFREEEAKLKKEEAKVLKYAKKL